MKWSPKAAAGVAALAGALALGSSAHAAYLPSLTVNKCLSAKVKQDGKGAAAYTGCNAKGASKAVATDPLCISKTSGKSTAAYAKLDGKGGCLTTGDATAADNAVEAYATQVDTAVGHGSGGSGKCDSAKQKLVGKYAAAITGCYAKAAGKGGTVDGLCTSKALGKLNTGIGKAQAKPPCSNTNDVVAAADTFINARACALDPSNPGCSQPCTPGTTRNVTVSFAGGAVAGITVDLGYPNAKVGIPGTGSDQSVQDRISGAPSGALVAANDHDNSISVGVVKTSNFNPGQLFIVQFDNCQEAPGAPVNAEFSCTVTDAANNLGNPVSGVTCSAVVN